MSDNVPYSFKAMFDDDVYSVCPVWLTRNKLYTAVYMDRPFNTDVHVFYKQV